MTSGSKRAFAAVGISEGLGMSDMANPPTLPSLPTGTVAFLFTDIEDSVGGWERHPKAMAAAIARHQTVEIHGGARSRLGPRSTAQPMRNRHPGAQKRAPIPGRCVVGVNREDTSSRRRFPQWRGQRFGRAQFQRRAAATLSRHRLIAAGQADELEHGRGSRHDRGGDGPRGVDQHRRRGARGAEGMAGAEGLVERDR